MNPSDGYIDQHPDALRLTLVDELIDPSQFSVYGIQEITFGGVRIRATIIGASHVITYETDDSALSEILACRELPNVSSLCAAQLVEPVQRKLPGFNYSFRAFRAEWTDPEPLTLEYLVRAAHRSGTGYIGLVKEFPQGDLLVTPKTVIVSGLYPPTGALKIRTAHSYPNVSGLILSLTTLAPNKGE